MKKTKQTRFPSKKPIELKPSERLSEFIDAFCEDFIAKDESSEEVAFISDVKRGFSSDGGEGFYYAEQEIKQELEYETDPKKRNVLQKQLKQLKKNEETENKRLEKINADFVVELERNGWTKEPQLQAIKEAYWHGKSDVPINHMKLQEDMDMLENERLKYARMVYLDRNPKILKDFCKRNEQFKDICEELPRHLPIIKENINKCLEENEEETEGAWEEQASLHRMWKP